MVDASATRVGDVVSGKYRIDAVLGEGGMGVVLAATHIELRSRVALKILLPRFRDDEIVRKRFEREGRAAVQLKSRHVGRVFDVGTLDTGAPYLVMELLDGEDLEDHASRNGPLAPDVVVTIVRQVCDALAEAHELGIVHRDLKPRNLFVTRSRAGALDVKVLDFGISKWTDGAELTRTSDVLGSPHFMSPEQLCRPRDVDARADIWALGVTMYRLLTGRAPFDGDTVPQICARVIGAAPESLATLRPELPPLLVRIIERCLEKDPAKRFASIRELVDALDGQAPRAGSALGGGTAATLRAADVAPAVGGPPRLSPSTLTATGRDVAFEPAASLPAVIPMSPLGPRRASVLALGALGAAIALALVGWIAARNDGRAASAPPEPTAQAAGPVAAPAPAPLAPASSASTEAEVTPPAPAAVTREEAQQRPAASVALGSAVHRKKPAQPQPAPSATSEGPPRVRH